MGLEPGQFFQNCSTTYKWNSWHTVERHGKDRKTVKLCWKTENKRAQESVCLSLSGTSNLNGSPAISLSAFSDSQWKTHTHTHSYTFWGRGGKKKWYRNEGEKREGKEWRFRSNGCFVGDISFFLSPLLRWQFITCLIVWMCLWLCISVDMCVCGKSGKVLLNLFRGLRLVFSERERERKIQR